MRQGRHTFAYRPGLPLQEYWSIFVQAPELQDSQKAVGQVEQMIASRCFQAGAREPGLHFVPRPAPSALDRAPRPVLPRLLPGVPSREALCPAQAARRQQNPNDDCTACHMPRFPSSNVPTAVTDHRLLRKPENAEPRPRKRLRLHADDVPLVNFFAKELDPQDPAVCRDLGLAFIYLTTQPLPGSESLAPVGLALLEKSLSTSPDDAAGWEAKGTALAVQGRKTKAMAAFETALAKAPERESTLDFAAELAEKMGRPADAIAYLRRLRAVNPWLWEYPYRLSKLLAKRGEWQSAVDETPARPPPEPDQ